MARWDSPEPSTLERTIVSDLEAVVLELGEPPCDGDLDCSYRNGSDRMVILRCVGPQGFFLERVVFPFELLNFTCPQSSEIKIWTHGLGGPELVESLLADELIINSSACGSEPAPLAALTGDLTESSANSPWLNSL